MKKKNRILSLIIAVLALTLLMSGCGGRSAKSGSDSQASVTAAAESSSQSESRTADGDSSLSESTEDDSISFTDVTPDLPLNKEDQEESSVLPESASSPAASVSEDTETVSVDEDGTYTSKDEVALYIHLYGHLPSNYITKSQAEKLGWDSSAGNLDEVAPGKSIGGGRFGNYEGILPEGNYKECDIDYEGGRRNAKRIVYSDEGAVYYTEDHYETFEQLY